MARKKTNWGKPGETGVTKDGIPWAVPETGPGLGSKILYTLFPGGGNYIPAGAKMLKASTAADALQRIMRKYGEVVSEVVDEDDRLVGFTQFLLDEKVPQPPQSGIGAKVGPNPLKHWWMGGGWDSIAGELVGRIGRSHLENEMIHDTPPRDLLLIRTDRRAMIWSGNMEHPGLPMAEYGLDQIGISPAWRPGGSAADDEGWRVDIAFPDGSWVGAVGANGNYVPGGSEFPADRDLLAELLGPPVTATVLPALGRG